ncbi:Pentatricopeptide repeat-containing protein [Acorus gramineus]|uniref:Pentatricopeptide repeat-containing protein n=1 Tax=Acorus gramineus TaxID=55184 RepID=A0AAV9B9F7_ACOGR|nr:Pentatricopeptide repeat-containing protein [Acorus gramineus]
MSSLSTTIVCNSTTPPPPKPPPPPQQPTNINTKNPSNPSLADKLRPLSLTLLSDPPSDTNPRLHKRPKSTWVNPTKPRPTVLSLRRHPRAPYFHNPNLRALSSLSKSSSTDDSAFTASLDSLPHLSRDDALAILNSLRSWHRSLLFLDWLKSRNAFPLETIFYNVALKSLRFARRYDLVEKLALEMIDGGDALKPDNVTYSTLITSAKRCGRFDKAIGWFERMYKTGLVPDEVTYSAALDVYARLGKTEEVRSLYERARAGGWRPDHVAFSVLAKMYGEAGDYDGIRYVFDEMRSVDVKPNLAVYNALLKALGKAGKPGLARSLFEEMVSAGVEPNEKTLTALIKIYGRARWARDALALWERMKANRWPMDFILYNTLLSMCADLGLEDEAERLFGEMKASENARPDSWSYTAMINIYASVGKPEKALALFEAMLGSEDVAPNVMGCTCLIQCLGRARRIEEAVRVFDVAIERGIQPDDRLCGCLLSVLTYCEGDGEAEGVLACLERANTRLVGLVKMLWEAEEEVGSKRVKEEMRGVLSEAQVDARRPFCNCLIDLCLNRGMRGRAKELLRLAKLYGLYPGLQTRKAEEWTLDLKSLSVGAARMAFEEWMEGVRGESWEGLPRWFAVQTGAGTHRYSQGLGSAFAAHVREVEAPFRESEEGNGRFVSTREEVVHWLRSWVSSAAAVVVA